MEQAIGGTIAGVIVGDWIVILVQAEVVHVHAKVDIKATVPIVIRYGRMGECPLGSARKFECIVFEREGSIALIEEEQGSGAADDEQVLTAVVVKIGKQCAGGIVQHADAGFFGDIFKSSVAP